MPPVAANIQGAVLCADPMASPTSTPSRQRNEEIKLQIIACLIVIPAFKSTAKSPRVIIKRIKIKNYLLDFFCTKFMGKFMAQNGDRCSKTSSNGGCKSSSDGKTIRQVM
jgi:hypothetical protein